MVLYLFFLLRDIATIHCILPEIDTDTIVDSFGAVYWGEALPDKPNNGCERDYMIYQ